MSGTDQEFNVDWGGVEVIAQELQDFVDYALHHARRAMITQEELDDPNSDELQEDNLHGRELRFEIQDRLVWFDMRSEEFSELDEWGADRPDVTHSDARMFWRVEIFCLELMMEKLKEIFVHAIECEERWSREIDEQIKTRDFQLYREMVQDFQDLLVEANSFNQI